MKSQRFTVAGFVAFAGASFLAGCSSESAPNQDIQTRGVLKVLGTEYGRYLAQHNGTAPKDEQALRAYLDSQMTRLNGYGVKAADDLLKSPRDGEALLVIFGKTIESPDSPGVPWAACERTGVDGMRMATNARGGVTVHRSQDLQQLIPTP